jgi:hypothetical protein
MAYHSLIFYAARRRTMLALELLPATPIPRRTKTMRMVKEKKIKSLPARTSSERNWSL